jgi:uncharacterized membrane protein YbaN (DUF454 family)
MEREVLIHVVRSVLFWTLVLAGVFAVATFAFMRWSRRYRKWLLQKPPLPTPDSDVWQKHRLPDEEPQDGDPGANIS